MGDAVDHIFWWVGAVACISGGVCGSLAFAWWCFDVTLQRLGLVGTIFELYYDNLKRKQDKTDG